MKCILNTIFVLITLSVFYISSTAKNVLVENRRVDTVTVKDMLYDGPDTVVALPRYEFRNDKRGHLLSTGCPARPWPSVPHGFCDWCPWQKTH